MTRFMMVLGALAWGISIGTAHAEPVEKGKPMPSYTLPDQFGEMHTLAPETRAVIIASEKLVSQAINTWLSGKDEDFLEKSKLEYVSDISPMPAAITKLFALPAMRKYKYKVILNRDDSFKDAYPRQDKKLALFLLDGSHTVTDIKFLDKPEEVEEFLK